MVSAELLVKFNHSLNPRKSASAAIEIVDSPIQIAVSRHMIIRQFQQNWTSLCGRSSASNRLQFPSNKKYALISGPLVGISASNLDSIDST